MPGNSFSNPGNLMVFFIVNHLPIYENPIICHVTNALWSLQKNLESIFFLIMINDRNDEESYHQSEELM